MSQPTTWYQDYLLTPRWARVRRRMLQRAGFRCQQCRDYDRPIRRVRLQVHHRSYTRLGQERWEDLEVLCRPCHEAAHGVPVEYRTTEGMEPLWKPLWRHLYFTKTGRAA